MTAAKEPLVSRLRTLLISHTRLTLLLLAFTVAVKAVVPPGFMVSRDGDGFLTVTICSAASGTSRQMKIAIPGKGDAGDNHSTAADEVQHCAFSGLGHAALGGTDSVHLAGPMDLVTLSGPVPLQAPPARDLSFLRPLLRGPPSLTV
ncbi:MAG: hypothetical protein D6763_07550 [Alphaproteobacteria bacterium]|nr:MAG: hypothetical protein D6763_07550 [Alphaproteobacteria bacterium]